MSFQAEASASQTPKKGGRGRGSRNHGQKMIHEGLEDIVTPNQKRPQSYRSTPKDIPGKNLMSPPPIPDQAIISSIEGLEIGSPMPSTKKKRQNKKKIGEKHENHTTVRSPAPEQTSSTPVKHLQMYAGPTFHASPAPSSLPIPKFFAQSMQAKERTSEPLYTPPSEESSEESSSQNGGDSPTMRPALRVLGNGNSDRREPSPLDIFFNADREEKARKARVQSTLSQERSHSASPGYDPRGQPQSAFPPPPQPASPGAADEHWAKTQALKQLLLFPQAQEASPTVDSGSASPSLGARQRPSSGARTVSETSTPTRFALNESPSINRSFYDSPSLTTPPSSARSQYHHQQKRPLPHHLRQQILNSLPLDQSPNIRQNSGNVAFFAQ